MRRLLAGLAVPLVLLLGGARPAHADPTAPAPAPAPTARTPEWDVESDPPKINWQAERATAKWSVHVDGPGCAKEHAAFEREIVLACDAMATCHVAPSRREAELEATLRCPLDGSLWSLETRTTNGMMLSSISLTGATSEDRMREAAVEIARDAAPERTLATENLRNTLIGGRDDRERDRIKSWARWDEVSSRQDRGLISVATGGTVGTSEVAGIGARLLGGYRVTSLMHLALTASAATSGATRARTDEWRRVQGGVAIGFGAPFDIKRVFGLMAEFGVDGTQRYSISHFGSETLLHARVIPSGYARGTVFFQIPVGPYVRPFLAPSLACVTDIDKQVVLAGLDLGATFPLF